MSDVKLTKYPEGSFRELLAIAWPVTLSSAAGCLMINVDRIMVRRYSMDAFNACFEAIQWYWPALFTILAFVLMAEVFVGQYNGSGRYREIGPIVWQMIWFCLATSLFFVPFSIYGPQWILSSSAHDLGSPYLKILILFIPIECIGCGALTAFFVGRGKTRIISIVAVVANIVNALLDYLFIFGWRWNGVEIIPAGGLVGAAIATVLSQLLKTAWLFALFFKRDHRERYKTGDYRLQLKGLWNCIRLGTPESLNRCIHGFSWAILTRVFADHTTPKDFQNHGIVNSLYLLCWCVLEGMGDGVRTVCSNAIGGKRFDLVRKNVHAWLQLGGMAILAVSTVMIFEPRLLTHFFLPGASPSELVPIYVMLRFAFVMFIFDTLQNNLLNILLASGDVGYTMLVNTGCFCSFSLLPSCIGAIYYGQGTIIFWQFGILDLIVVTTLFTIRYRQGLWMKRRVI